jgi:hypothetical protein
MKYKEISCLLQYVSGTELLYEVVAYFTDEKTRSDS